MTIPLLIVRFQCPGCALDGRLGNLTLTCHAHGGLVSLIWVKTLFITQCLSKRRPEELLEKAEAREEHRPPRPLASRPRHLAPEPYRPRHPGLRKLQRRRRATHYERRAGFDWGKKPEDEEP